MLNEYTTFYIEANIVCIIIFLMMLTREMGTVGRQTKQIIFINITVAHMLYFVNDIVCVLVIGNYIPHTALIASVVNVLNAILLSAITGFWFVYAELSQGEEYILTFKHRMYVLAPAMLETVLMIFLFTFFPRTVMDEENSMTTFYYIAFLCVPAMYVVVSAVRSFIRALRKENYGVRTQYLSCAIYPVIITVFGILQIVVINAPLFCFGCTIMMLYVYIISLNDQVSIDELTRLNNRTQLKKYVASESLKQGADKQSRYVLMIDLNKFKGINDQYGHVEGDNALKRTADALKTACGGNPMKTFIARFGGDEFIIIAKTDDEELVKELCKNIKETLVKMNDESGAKYDLTCCIGYCQYNGDVSGFQSAMVKADEQLYKEKAEIGSVR